MKKYTIGIDFGTESGRVIIVDVENGKINSSCVIPYKHGVISGMLPTVEQTHIPPDFALQHPKDYLDVLYEGIPTAVNNAGVFPKQIIGIGIDFTSSTMVVTDEDLIPLCFHTLYQENPHSWVKLWKHHGSKSEAEILQKKAAKAKYNWFKSYGSHISTEWFIPKCLEIINKAPNIYQHSSYFLETGDWIVSLLIGEVIRSNCSLGFKALWNEKDEFPKDFFSSINPELENLINTKLRGKVGKVGERAGKLTLEMADKLGLNPDVSVGVSIIDAHSAVLGTGASQKNQLTMVMGTSTCHLILSEEKVNIPGISGVVKDAIIPGVYAYESGQTAVGDLFAWYEKQVPFTFVQEAYRQQTSVFDLLEKRASTKKPGKSGIISLDWHNGNRSILSNPNLTGLILGLNMSTNPEDIYRAYLEATAFGAKIIIDNYTNHGLTIDEVFANGGLPQKNALLMQIYADILNRNIHVSSNEYSPAVGAAILGATASGREKGGYDKIDSAMKHMKQSSSKTYYPIKEHVKIYNQLFEIYMKLHNEFSSNNLMDKLRNI